MMELGDKKTFTPCAFIGFTADKAVNTYAGVPRLVTGEVDYINEAHHWYRVRYEVLGTMQHECFKS